MKPFFIALIVLFLLKLLKRKKALEGKLKLK